MGILNANRVRKKIRNGSFEKKKLSTAKRVSSFTRSL